MHRLHRHVRGSLVALVAIALSAGVALAARPSSAPPAAAGDGLRTASDAAGKVVPVTAEAPAAPDRAGNEPEDPSEDQNEDQAQTKDETTDQAESQAERKQNHGWFVSEAAKAETSTGFANHGAYVSSVAKGDDGKPTAPAAATTGQQKAAAAKAAAAQRKASHSDHGH